MKFGYEKYNTEIISETDKKRICGYFVVSDLHKVTPADIRLRTEELLDEKELEQIIRNYNARILEMDRKYTVIEKTGHSNETESLFNELKKYGILQFVRSGRVAVTKMEEELLTIYLEKQQERYNELKNVNKQR